MDHIIQALERAKANSGSSPLAQPERTLDAPGAGMRAQRPQQTRIDDVALSLSHLERMRVFAHDVAHPTTKSVDLVRTQVLQSMEENGWRLLAVTSPTPGCGKTFTALNLAMSMARQPDSSVLLVDGDLHKPQISHRLGFSRDTGLRALLEGKASLQEAITHVAVGGFHFSVLSCERPTSRASDWAGSPQMEQVLRSVRADRDFKVVILDLPPLLAGDETISILPHVDCVLMIAAAGSTKTSDLKDCAQYVKTTPVVRVVFNRAPGASLEYY